LLRATISQQQQLAALRVVAVTVVAVAEVAGVMFQTEVGLWRAERMMPLVKVLVVVVVVVVPLEGQEVAVDQGGADQVGEPDGINITRPRRTQTSTILVSPHILLLESLGSLLLF
jgi:hypothetical protein